ncbi:RagB/SusD family nutrient uptake outer membrane protein [Flavobacterium sp. 270]|uniref:RagB/SusD family nutrient uptake outer membrane protein n=1 Tax=Flavobacterium sp. 270 TaxID=2512114 RepID=UPI001416F39B|nr:RagB/SusD family nutrient uptake outer membrane protein [Flavobacterium sp. 270]
MKSNNFLIVTALSILITGFSSCQGDFLDENPKSFIAPTNFYKTEADANAALVAVYNGLRAIYSQDITFVGDMAGEQTFPGVSNSNVDRSNIDAFQFEPSNTILLGNWNNNYVVINRANAVLDRVPAIDMPAASKDVILAEARFLRAFSYFNLVRTFGGVPLRLAEATPLHLKRSTADEVYAVILDDLKQAEAKLPAVQPAANLGRATKGAASSLLAYVYLTKKDWTNAAAKAQEVIDNKGAYGYGLYPTPADVWKIANENKLEHIFSIQFQSGPEGFGSAYAQFYLSRTANVIQASGISGFGQNLVEDKFWKSFDVNDTRRDASILSRFVDPKTNKVYQYPSTDLTELSIFKYFDPAPYARSNNNNNYPILRYADVLLIKAEALNELNGPTADAYDAINQIRKRAGVNMTLLSGLTQVQFRAAVLQERSFEFCFESKRYFDLIRTEQLVPIMTAAGKNPQPKNLLFPIPQKEIDTNQEINQEDQNPGY